MMAHANDEEPTGHDYNLDRAACNAIQCGALRLLATVSKYRRNFSKSSALSFTAAPARQSITSPGCAPPLPKNAARTPTPCATETASAVDNTVDSRSTG